MGVSGGGDSTALLLLLVDATRDRETVLVPAHVAHGLRGTAGALDARFAADLARDLGLGFALRPVDVAGLRRKGESLEACARRYRYEALLLLARELGAGCLVATGHTLDDQAETVLLNLHRRSGRGRGGIRERRADGVVRPLLPFTRREVRDFLAERGQAWREDETNDDERLTRNRIRRVELPGLEARWPGVSARLARAGTAWTARLDGLDARIDAALASSGTAERGPFPRSVFAALDREASGRLLVRAAGLRGRVPGRRQVEKVVRRLETDRRFAEALGGLRVTADASTVRLAAPRAGAERPALLDSSP